MSPPRKFDWDEAQRLRSLGATFLSIAARFGVSEKAVRLACIPKERKAASERSREWQMSGTCIDCGGRCSRNRSKELYRCAACAHKAKVKMRDGLLYCPSCDEWKHPDLFSPAAASPFRKRATECRTCSCERRQKNRELNREREREYERQRRKSKRTAA